METSFHGTPPRDDALTEALLPQSPVLSAVRKSLPLLQCHRKVRNGLLTKEVVSDFVWISLISVLGVCVATLW